MPSRGGAAASRQRHAATHGALHRLGPPVRAAGRPARTRRRWSGRPTHAVIAPADVYRLYFHGPAYQVVGEAWRDDGAAVGRLAEHLPADQAPADAATLLGPRLEELCFQVAGLWEAGREGRLALPAHVDRLSVLGELATGESASGVVALARPVAGDPGCFDCRGPRRRRQGPAAARRLSHRARCPVRCPTTSGRRCAR